jgi:hypothetical protein
MPPFTPMSTVRHRVRREARAFLGRWPSVARHFGTGEFPTDATEVCIEGYLRSGNTFTVIAFQHVQPRVVSIAHHVHAAGAVIEAVRMGKPTLLLIRPPEESSLSYVVRWPHLTIGHALRGYVWFYRPLLAHRAGFVVGRFEEVTSHLGEVIERLNARFGTMFVPFEPTEANLRATEEELDRWDANTSKREPAPIDLARGRPTDAKEAVKAELRERYRSASLSRWRAQAEDLYRTIIADARSPS